LTDRCFLADSLEGYLKRAHVLPSCRFMWIFVFRYSGRWENHSRKRTRVKSRDDLHQRGWHGKGR